VRRRSLIGDDHYLRLYNEDRITRRLPTFLTGPHVALVALLLVTPQELLGGRPVMSSLKDLRESRVKVELLIVGFVRHGCLAVARLSRGHV
jgi:hypothetical protein